MVSENIFITSRRIAWSEDSVSREINSLFYLEEDSNKAFPSEKLREVLLKKNLSASTRVNFILDVPFISVRFFELPSIPKSKIRGILAFELESSTAFDINEIDYDFIVSGATEDKLYLRVYIINKVLRNSIVELCSEFSIQLQNILPLSEIIYNLEVATFSSKNSFLYLHSDVENSKIFFVNDRFYEDLSVIDHDLDHDQNVVYDDFLMSRLSSRIRLLELEKGGVEEIILSENLKEKICVEENHEIRPLGNDFEFGNEQIVLSNLYLSTGASILNKDLKKIFKAKNQILQSLTRFKRDFIFGSVSLAVLMILWGITFFTGLIFKENKIDTLDSALSDLIDNNLSKGVSKSNAYFILKQKHDDLLEEFENQSKLLNRRYYILGTFDEISDLKQEITDLKIISLNISERSINFTGTLKKYDDFEKMKSRLEEQYGARFKVKFNQRTDKEQVDFQFFLTRKT